MSELRGGQVFAYGDAGTVTVGGTYEGGLSVHYPNDSSAMPVRGFNEQFVAPKINDAEYQERLRRGLAQLQYGLTTQEKVMSGTKPIVICNGTSHEAEDLVRAQEIAERLAHQHQADAYILKPVKKIAPKRDVVTTELE